MVGVEKAIRLAIAFIMILFMSWLLAYLHVPATMRPDLFFYLNVVMGFVLPPMAHLLFSVTLGYIVDTLVGKLWGLHVANYVMIASIMRVSSDQLDVQSPLFHALLTLIYVTLHQICIAFYARGLWLEAGTEFFAKMWALKSLVSIIVGVPFIALLGMCVHQEKA